MRKYEVLKRPILTEKTYQQTEVQSKYSFEVLKNANKTEIALAFKEIFGVKPIKVNVINIKPQITRTGTKHPGTTAHLKKAIITLPKGTKLNIMGDEAAAKEAEEQKKKDEVKVDKKETKETKEATTSKKSAVKKSTPKFKAESEE